MDTGDRTRRVGVIEVVSVTIRHSHHLYGTTMPCLKSLGHEPPNNIDSTILGHEPPNNIDSTILGHDGHEPLNNINSTIKIMFRGFGGQSIRPITTSE